MLIVRTGKINENAECGFNDVEKNEWYYKYVASAFENKITFGDTLNNFGIGKAMTREDAAVFICRTIGEEKKSGELKFVDSDSISEYARESIGALYDKGIISGNEKNEFMPKDCLTRAEAAKLIYFAAK